MSGEIVQDQAYNIENMNNDLISKHSELCIKEYEACYDLAKQQLATEEKLLESCTAHQHQRPHRSVSSHQLRARPQREDTPKGYRQMAANKPLQGYSSVPVIIKNATPSTNTAPVPYSPPKTPITRPVLGRPSARSTVRTNLWDQFEQQKEHDFNRLQLNSEANANAYIEARAAQDTPSVSPKPYPFFKTDPLKNARRALSSRGPARYTKDNSPFGVGVGQSPAPKSITPSKYAKTSRDTPSPSKMVTPSRIYRGSHRESMTPTTDTSRIVFSPALTPVTSPKISITQALEKLKSPDWEKIIGGLELLVRLVRFHTESVRPHLHVVNMTAMMQFANLRSQVARAICQFFNELFTNFGKSMECDVDKICEKLLDKSADTNRFIREDANGALGAMVQNLSVLKTLSALEIGMKHKNPIARATTSKMVAQIVAKTGPDRCIRELGHKLLPMLAKLLQEGSLETRIHAKNAVATLVSHSTFQSQLKRYVSEEDLRNVTKSINAIKSGVVNEGRKWD